MRCFFLQEVVAKKRVAGVDVLRPSIRTSFEATRSSRAADERTVGRRRIPDLAVRQAPESCKRCVEAI